MWRRWDGDGAGIVWVAVLSCYYCWLLFNVTRKSVDLSGACEAKFCATLRSTVRSSGNDKSRGRCEWGKGGEDGMGKRSCTCGTLVRIGMGNY